MSRSTGRRARAFIAGCAAAMLVLASQAVVSSARSDDAPEQLKNGGFDSGSAGWFTYGTTDVGTADGRLCTTVPGGLANPWDAGLGQNDVPLVNGSSYTLSFDASADPGSTFRANVQLGVDPFTSFFSQDVPLAADAQHFEFTFTASADATAAQVVFHVGANPADYHLCLDNVSLRGGEPPAPYVPDTGPRVRVNQVGYLPHGPKNATLVTEATEAVTWFLEDGTGELVANGTTTPRGVDASSGQNVHTIDFGSFDSAGTNFTLHADGETSHPFDISADVYKQLRSDSLQFFYIQRSGIAIDGGLVGDQYARPAGHVGVAPNQGDTDVPCQAGVCDHRLDVRGGWYDAGDHGKYVVNGGIAAYQVLNTFERTKTAISAGGGAALGDGTLRVPERGNNVPDILDEARWELDFLMRMQVPAGQPLAGMAHHKIHDQNWTGLPLQPQDDPQPRELHPPSTAATLNLAATAAQCARLFAPYDAAYANKCLTSAKSAYTAAKAHPSMLASGTDSNGGGAYNDDDVSDEFYWSAVELYLSTGEQQYLTDLTASPHHTDDVFGATGFSWPATAALGRLDLATVPSGLPAADRQRVRQSVITSADSYLATLAAEAYGLPMPGAKSNYFWGANSNIINNLVVIATAYDLTGDQKYQAGALQGMDYIFGRNALNHSYVTGWGEASSQNQHTRIYAHQLDASCAPQFCFVDDINSYSTNEVAVNWNSALAWISSFLADQGAGQVLAAGACKIGYAVRGTWSGGFKADVAITNTGSAPINGWSLRWAWTGGQRVTQGRLATVSQTGATVTAANVPSNKLIKPGRSTTFGITVKTASGANPLPGLFTLNGKSCR